MTLWQEEKLGFLAYYACFCGQVMLVLTKIPWRRVIPLFAFHNAMRYKGVMIKSFESTETERIWKGNVSRKFPGDIQQRVLRKLFMLDKAQSLDDLMIPPANRLEHLKGDRKDQYSIRVNDQWRLCFLWKDGNAENVQLVDYH